MIDNKKLQLAEFHLNKIRKMFIFLKARHSCLKLKSFLFSLKLIRTLGKKQIDLPPNEAL